MSPSTVKERTEVISVVCCVSDQRHPERPSKLHSHNVLADYLSVDLSAIRAPVLARFPSERKQRPMVGGLHDCIISDTLAKRFSRNGFEAENDDENDNGISLRRPFISLRPT